jgi:hypothetical protein
MSKDGRKESKPLDPRIILGSKYVSFFLSLVLVFLFVGLVLVPRETIQRDLYRTRKLENLVQGQGVGEFQPLESSEFSGFYPLEDGTRLAVVSSIVHQSSGLLAVRFDEDQVPISIVPLSVPWFGRLTKAFPEGLIASEYRPEMGVRALLLYEILARGGIDR